MSVSLFSVARDLEDAGWLVGVREVDADCVLARPTINWGLVAREASLLSGGQWWLSSEGVTWMEGRRVSWLIHPDALPPVHQARTLLRQMGLTCGWSVGSAARALLRFCFDGGVYESGVERLMSGLPFGYCEVAPGRLRQAFLFDVESCYFSLLSRLPAVRISLLRDGSILFHRHTDDEWAKWRDVLAVVRNYKLLRNAIVGCALGRSGATPCFVRGERREIRGERGALRGAALLVVRTAYELCALAARESDAVYAHVDCVITPCGVAPSVWRSKGLEVRLQASGEADVRARGIYRVGGKATKWYAAGSRFVQREERPALPPEMFSNQWL